MTNRRDFLSALGAASAATFVPRVGWGAECAAATFETRGLAAASDFLLDAGLAYLQTGSLGPTPAPVLERTIAAWKELERNPVFYGYGVHEQAMEAVRTKAAALIGCSDDELVLTTCTTDGMNRVAQGLDWSPGDRVLTTDQEHPGGRVCWDYLVRTRGVVLDVVPIAPGEHDAAAIVSRVERAITPRTRVLSFSHLLSSTGMRLPVAELSAVARARNCLSVVDGAQAVGGIAVDVKALGCDVYATSGHKWLLAPKGTGLLYLSKALGTRIDPISLQSGRAAYSASSGVGNIPGVLGLGAAIDYLNARGIGAIESHNLALRAYLERALQQVPAVRVVAAREGEQASPMLTYILPDAVKSHDLYTRLLEKHRVVVKVVPGQWLNGHRISTHLFNTEQDVDALVTALKRELA